MGYWARCGPPTCPAHTGLAAEIRAGQVHVNTYGPGCGVELPFGGFKKSGYGREKGYQALAMFTATKTVVRFVLATNPAPRVTTGGNIGSRHIPTRTRDSLGSTG
jgi:hypothetical protein